MRIVAFAALAASAAAFAPATAQTVQDPDPYYGVPTPPPGPMMPPRRPGPVMNREAPQVRMHVDGSMVPPPMPPMEPGAAPHRMMQMSPLAPMGSMTMHPGMQGRMHHIGRGGRVPPAWANRRFEVRDWRRFGFPAPFAGGRWIRFYDDALLIDGDGLVYDSRPDWRWDGDADERSYDERGYEDHAYGDRREGGAWIGERERHWGGGGENVRTRVFVEHGPPPPPPPYGGYGYGPVVVTETIVTEAPVVEQRSYVRTYVQRVRVVRHHRHVRRCLCRPASVLGERG